MTTLFDYLALDHAQWSEDTFGSTEERDHTGPLAHLRKELEEIEQDPTDATEWADALLLLLDASRRAGVSHHTLLLTAIEKLAINKRRKWQTPGPDGSVEHVRSD